MNRNTYIIGGLLVAGGIAYYLYTYGGSKKYKIKGVAGTSYQGVTIFVPSTEGLNTDQKVKLYNSAGEKQAEGGVLDVRKKGDTDKKFAAVRVDVSKATAESSAYLKIKQG
jgi:hypothetical protein